MAYTKVFKNIYPNGWKNKPDLSTPITAESMQQYNDTINSIETYLKDNEIGSSKSIYDLSDTNFTNKNANSAVFVNYYSSASTGWKYVKAWNGKTIETDDIVVSDDYETESTYYSTDFVTDYKGGYVKTNNLLFYQLQFTLIDVPFGNNNFTVFYNGSSPSPSYNSGNWVNGIAIREEDGAQLPIQLQSRNMVIYVNCNTKLIGEDSFLTSGTWNVTLLTHCQ